MATTLYTFFASTPTKDLIDVLTDLYDRNFTSMVISLISLISNWLAMFTVSSCNGDI